MSDQPTQADAPPIESSDCYAAIASRILDLVSHRFSDHGRDCREGHDTFMHGVDEEAAELIKQWSLENVGKVVTDTLMTQEFLTGFAAAFASTPLPSTIQSLESSIDTMSV